METKVHTYAEVLVGTLLGVVITVLMFEISEMFVFLSSRGIGKEIRSAQWRKQTMEFKSGLLP